MPRELARKFSFRRFTVCDYLTFHCLCAVFSARSSSFLHARRLCAVFFHTHHTLFSCTLCSSCTLHIALAYNDILSCFVLFVVRTVSKESRCGSARPPLICLLVLEKSTKSSRSPLVNIISRFNLIQCFHTARAHTRPPVILTPHSPSSGILSVPSVNMRSAGHHIPGRNAPLWRSWKMPVRPFQILPVSVCQRRLILSWDNCQLGVVSECML